MGTRISAPFCAGLLGELGADVIKVELPGEGDFMRTMGPFVPVEDGPDYSLSWAVEGRGRRGVTCDLRHPEGKELFKRLVATADVLCENFRPGTMERWGLGPDDLPDDLVFVRISVFGQTGPIRRGPASTGWASHSAACCISPASRTGHRATGVTISDYLTGTFAAFAAVAALYGRDASASGRRRAARLGGGHRRAVVRVDPARPRVDAGRLRPAGHRPPARGQPPVALGAPRQLPHSRRLVRVHRRRLGRQLLAPLRAPWADPT